MSQSARELAIKFIASLNEKELVDFFYDAISSKNDEQEFLDGFYKDRICLIETHFGKYEHELEEEHYSEFMAKPTDELAQLDWVLKENFINHSGKCETCKALITCVAKEAVCPICDSLVECT
jgi:hypothetical protein